MLAALLIALAPRPASAVTFTELADTAAVSSTTAQIATLGAQASRASVGSAVSRLLPSASLSDSLTWTQLNTDRFQREGETELECAERLGRVCAQLLVLGSGFTIPGEMVNNNLGLMFTQPVWSGRAVVGVAQATTRRDLTHTQNALKLDNQSGELVQAYVELQAAEETLALSDAKYAAKLRDLAEDLELQRRELALTRRQLVATTSRYRDGGRASLDQVLATRRQITTLEKQIVQTTRQQVLTQSRRWIDAGRADAFLAALTASDRGHAAAGRCTGLSR